jgi:hypothetical protein
MPRGMQGVRQVSKDQESWRGGGGQRALWFRLQSGDETVVRFLEQGDDVAWAYMHQVPVEGRQWGRPVPCLDQDKEGIDCPGCEREIPLKFQGYINLIWEDAPVFKRDDDGRLQRDSDGDPITLSNKPQVAIWSSGIRLFEELEEMDTNYRGLTSRRFKVKRKGKKLDTKYIITPEDIDAGPQDFTDEETALANSKYDLGEYITPGTYEDFLRDLEQSEGRDGNGFQRVEPPKNPFMEGRSRR